MSLETRATLALGFMLGLLAGLLLATMAGCTREPDVFLCIYDDPVTRDLIVETTDNLTGHQDHICVAAFERQDGPTEATGGHDRMERK